MTFAAALTAVRTIRFPSIRREQTVPAEREEAPSSRFAVSHPDPLDWSEDARKELLLHSLTRHLMR